MTNDLYAFLTSASTLGLDPDRAAAIALIRAAIGTRMYRDTAAEGTQMPYLRYQLIDTKLEHELAGGNVGLFEPRVQIDVVAQTGVASDALADQVTIALDGYQGPMVGTDVDILLWDNASTDYEPGRLEYRTILDFRVLNGGPYTGPGLGAGGGQGGGGAQGPEMTTTVTISAAEILAGGTPVVVIPGVAGKLHVPTAVVMEYKPGTSPYTFPDPATNLELLLGGISGAQIMQITANTVISDGDLTPEIGFITNLADGVWSEIAPTGKAQGADIVLWMDSTPPIGGDGTLVVTVQYLEV